MSSIVKESSHESYGLLAFSSGHGGSGCRRSLLWILGPDWIATLGLTPQIPRERTLDVVSNTLTSMISFIVPAHNEQACLGRTLQAIHESARAVGQPYEIVVSNDASTDATAEIAQQNNARVVNVNHRQIAATRNSGGRAATGDRLFFVDADTRVNPRAIKAAMRAMDKGAVGGGGPTWINRNEPVPLYIRLIGLLSIPVVKLIGFSGGAFMFCTREGFQASGGFSEKMFWGEEGSFALALKRQGRFVGLWQWVYTSGRRFRRTSALELFLGGIRMVFSPHKMFTERSAVEKIWYDSERADDDKMPRFIRRENFQWHRIAAVNRDADRTRLEFCFALGSIRRVALGLWNISLPRGTDFLAVCVAAVLEFVSPNVLVGMDKNGRDRCVLRLAGLGRNARCDLVLALALQSLRHLRVHVLNKFLLHGRVVH